MKKISDFLPILVMALGILGLLASPSHALYPNERYETLWITSVNPDNFTNVAGSISTLQNWVSQSKGEIQESYTQTFTTSWVASSATWTATGMTVSNIKYPTIADPTASATFTMPLGTASGTSLLYRTLPSNAVPPLSIDNGRYYIEGVWSGYGGAYNFDNNGYFEYVAILPGDWSKEGNQYMGHVATWNNLWTVDKNFVFADDVTTFKAHYAGYNSEEWQSLGLNVRLYGGLAPVPEPATMLLLGFGIVGLAGVRRFKK